MAGIHTEGVNPADVDDAVLSLLNLRRRSGKRRNYGREAAERILAARKLEESLLPQHIETQLHVDKLLKTSNEEMENCYDEIQEMFTEGANWVTVTATFASEKQYTYLINKWKKSDVCTVYILPGKRSESSRKLLNDACLKVRIDYTDPAAGVEAYLNLFFINCSKEYRDRFKDSGESWEGFGPRGMHLVKLICEVFRVNVVELDDLWHWKEMLNSRDYAKVMEVLLELQGRYPEKNMQRIFEDSSDEVRDRVADIPKDPVRRVHELKFEDWRYFAKQYDDIIRLGGDITTIVENEYYGRYGFKTKSWEDRTKKIAEPKNIVNTAGLLKSTAHLLPVWSRL